ncbi:MAG TPA: hypothetical protein VM370_11675 [Candidatus Thermoplasmatota archaeon]|nr:hypothetical protein [Candidatus Thermoplasmatota archaeon]
MRRATISLLAALLLAPAAVAQMAVRPPMMTEPGVKVGFGGPFAEIRIESKDKDYAPFQNPWLVLGQDNVLNLTLRNDADVPMNATFHLNVTGATFSSEDITLSAEPYGYVGRTFVVHPDDAGMVSIVAGAVDAFQTGGEPLRAVFDAPALALPSMRFLDPPEEPETSEDEEFEQVDVFTGPRMGIDAYARVRPGESIAPRVELANPFETTTAGFRLTMQTGPTSPSVDVPSLEPGDTFVAEFPEFTPLEASFGGPFFGGPMGRQELRPNAELTVGGAPITAGAMHFRLDRGAVVDASPTFATIDIQDGLAVDIFAPRDPQLGAPTRLKYNLTNLQTTPAQGTLTITLMTPSGLFYEVQGPETHQVHVALGPGERTSGAIEFTPRVTGAWQASTLWQAAQGFGMGGGASFEVKGPLRIGFDRTDQIFARIGEPVEVGVVLESTDTLQDAQLRISAGSNYYRDPSTTSGSRYRPGFADTLVLSSTPTSSLGTLRPGGTVNATIQVVGRSSGTYNIVPYVLAEGFAYTSSMTQQGGPMPMDSFVYMPSVLSVAVQARAVPPGLSLAPLTLGLAFFVGVWTFRTRFVR